MEPTRWPIHLNVVPDFRRDFVPGDSDGLSTFSKQFASVIW